MKSFKEYLPEGWDKSSLTENAEELNIGDDVIITGNVEFKGSTGVISDFDSKKAFVVVNLYNHGKHSFHSSDVSYNEYADSDDERENMFNNDSDYRNWSDSQVDEAKRPAQTQTAYEDWDDHYDEYFDEVFDQKLTAAILEYVRDKFGGKAWFKGGSYAYLIDATKPNFMQASDGSPVQVANLAAGLDDYCDRGIFKDFAESPVAYWGDFFRPVKDPNRLAKDGAPMHGNDQAEHEYNNMMGEANKHSFIGKIQRHHELKGKVDSTWDDAVAAEKRGDKKAANRSFEKHVRYANLERPGTWRTVKEDVAPDLIDDIKRLASDQAEHESANIYGESAMPDSGPNAKTIAKKLNTKASRLYELNKQSVLAFLSKQGASNITHSSKNWQYDGMLGDYQYGTFNLSGIKFKYEFSGEFGMPPAITACDDTHCVEDIKRLAGLK